MSRKRGFDGDYFPQAKRRKLIVKTDNNLQLQKVVFEQERELVQLKEKVEMLEKIVMNLIGRPDEKLLDGQFNQECSYIM